MVLNGELMSKLYIYIYIYVYILLLLVFFFFFFFGFYKSEDFLLKSTNALGRNIEIFSQFFLKKIVETHHPKNRLVYITKVTS